MKRDFPIFGRNPGLVFLDTAASAQKPAAVIDEVVGILPHRLRQRASRRLSPERALDRALRGRARDGAALPQRAGCARDRVRARRDRGDQPRRLQLGHDISQARRRGPGHRARASRQHRAVAAHPRAHRAEARRRADRRHRRARHGCVRAPARPAHAARRGDAARQRHRRDGAGRGDRAARACAGRARCWSMAARRRRGCPSTCRRSAATSMSSPATRPMARPASACSGRSAELLDDHAAVPGRRRHDPLGHVRGDDLPGAAAPLRGRHARHFRRHRPRPRARLHRGAGAATRSPSTRRSSPATASIVCRACRASRLVAAGQRRLGILSFHVDGIHPHDLAQVLDQHGVAVRAGHHCAQPLLDKLGLAATTRASLGVYNDESDIDALCAAIEAAQTMFTR